MGPAATGFRSDDRQAADAGRRPLPAEGGHGSVNAGYNAGVDLQRRGLRDQAARIYRSVLEQDPRHAAALNNLGQILYESGRRTAARRCFERALAIRPDFAEPHFNLGGLAAAAGDPAAACDHYRRAVALKPSMAEAWNNLGNLLKQQGELTEAVACYRQSVRLNPEMAETHYNLGSALRLAGQLEPAAAELMAALRIRPGYAEVHNNLGLTWKAHGDNALAAEAFTRAIRIDPRLAEARWNRSLLHLQQGNYAPGWEDYEWRFRIPQCRQIYPHPLRQPRWQGQADKALTLLVHDEQGFGDTLQFVRYLPMARERCGRIILETRRELMGLLQGIAGADELIERPADPRPPVAAHSHVALLSLPGLFGTTPETIPAPVPYLHPNPDKARRWARRLSGPGFKIGLVWAGRPEHANDRNRSCPLALFGPLLRLPDLRWFGLQKGPAAMQAESEPFTRLLVNVGPELNDFAETAAAIAGLDLVLSVDTAVVHLAGAMGKPVWVLLSSVSDWRWMIGREDSPWYPGMRLFRQQRPGDWPGVLQRVAEAMACRSSPAGAGLNPPS
jgi:tetratricopeptide (TPR) repeat protein